MTTRDPHDASLLAESDDESRKVVESGNGGDGAAQAGGGGAGASVPPPVNAYLWCDFMQGNVRSPLLTFLSFAFLLGGAMMFIVILFVKAPVPGRTLTFVAPPPSVWPIGVPMPPFTVLVKNSGGGVVPDAEVQAFLIPSPAFRITVQTSDNLGYEIPSKVVDCTGHNIVAAGTYDFTTTNDRLCQPHLFGGVIDNVATSSVMGIATFEGLKLAVGVPVAYLMTVQHSYVDPVLGPQVAVVTQAMTFEQSVLHVDRTLPDIGETNRTTGVTYNFSANVNFLSPTADTSMLAVVLSIPLPPVLEGILSFYPVSDCNGMDAVIDGGIAPVVVQSCVPAPVGTLLYCNATVTGTYRVLSTSCSFASLALFIGGYSLTLSEFTLPNATALVTTHRYQSPEPYNISIEPGEIPDETSEAKKFGAHVTVRAVATGRPVVGIPVYAECRLISGVTYQLEPKVLLGNISGLTNAKGVAHFSSLQFTSLGSPGVYAVLFSVDGNALLSPPIVVRSRVEPPAAVRDVALSLLVGFNNFTLGAATTMRVTAGDGSPIPGKRFFVHPLNAAATAATFTYDFSTTDNTGFAYLRSLLVTTNVGDPTLVFAVTTDNITFARLTVTTWHRRNYRGAGSCVLFSANLVNTIGSYNGFPVFSSLAVYANFTGLSQPGAVTCCLKGGFCNENSIVIGSNDTTTAVMKFPLPPHRLADKWLETLECYDPQPGCRGVTQRSLDFWYKSAIRELGHVTPVQGLGNCFSIQSDLSAAEWSSLDVPNLLRVQYIVLLGLATFVRRGAPLLQDPDCAVDNANSVMCCDFMVDALTETAFYFTVTVNHVRYPVIGAAVRSSVPPIQYLEWIVEYGPRRTIAVDVQVAIPNTTSDVTGLPVTIDGRYLYAMVLPTPPTGPLVAETLQDCWSSTALLSSWPCVAGVDNETQALFFPTAVVTTTAPGGNVGVASFILQELSGLTSPGTTLVVMAVNSDSYLQTLLQIPLNMTSCSGPCFDPRAASVNSFPHSSLAGESSSMTFSVTTSVTPWEFGFIAAVRCVAVATGFPQDCFVQPNAESPYFLSAYFNSLLTQTTGQFDDYGELIVRGLYFPGSTPTGQYIINLVVPGAVFTCGTITVGVSDCVVIPSSQIPATLAVMTPTRVTVSVQCDGRPKSGVLVKLSMRSTTWDCDGPACGWLQPESSVATTDMYGNAVFSAIPIAVGAFAPSTVMLRFAALSVDDLMALIELARYHGVPSSSLIPSIQDPVTRLFTSATNYVSGADQGNLQVGPIPIANDVAAVAFIVPLAVNCVINDTSSSCAANSPVVNVTDASGAPLSGRYVVPLVFDAAFAGDSKTTVACADCAAGIFTDDDGLATVEDLVITVSVSGSYVFCVFVQGVSACSDPFDVITQEEQDVLEAKENAENGSVVLFLALLVVLYANTPHSHWVGIPIAIVLTVAFLVGSPFLLLHYAVFNSNNLRFSFYYLYAVAIVALLVLITMLVLRVLGRTRTWARMIDNEAAMLRAFRYTYYMLRQRQRKTRQRALDDAMRRQAQSLRHRLFSRPAHAILQWTADAKFEPLRYFGENIEEALIGEEEEEGDAGEGGGGGLDLATFAAPMEHPPPFELEPSVPQRFLIVVAFAVSLSIMSSYVMWFLANAFREYNEEIVAYVVGEPRIDERMSLIFHDLVRQAVEMLIAAFGEGTLRGLRVTYPLIDEINFATLANFAASVAIAVNDYSLLVVTVALLLAFVTLLLTIIIMFHEVRRDMKRARRGLLRGEVELEEADEYVGFHAVNILISFLFAALYGGLITIFFILIVHFMGEILAGAGGFIVKLLGPVALGEIVVGWFMAQFGRVGLNVMYPATYSAWSAVAGVLSVFGGVFITALRFIKYVTVGGLLFGRVDICILPPTLFMKDRAYTSYVSLIRVDNVYNNAIKLTFLGHLAALRELKLLQSLGVTDATPAAMGFSVRLPNLRNMVRVTVSSWLGVVHGHSQRTHGRLFATLHDFCFPFVDSCISRDDLHFNPAALLPIGDEAVRRRRHVRTWFLFYLLTICPTLRKYRKHRLLHRHHFDEHGHSVDHEHVHHHGHHHHHRHRRNSSRKASHHQHVEPKQPHRDSFAASDTSVEMGLLSGGHDGTNTTEAAV